MFTLAFAISGSWGECGEVNYTEAGSDGNRFVSVVSKPLIFTQQILGRGDTLQTQVTHIFKELSATLKQADIPITNAVRLNVYLKHPEDFHSLGQSLDSHFEAAVRPTITWVSTDLPGDQSLVAMDAVAYGKEGADFQIQRTQASTATQAIQTLSVLPTGTRVFISGQAEKGDGTLSSATTQTLKSLNDTLIFLGLNRTNIVQIKSFLTPMKECETVRQSIIRFFEGLSVPPCVYVEWKSSLPIEIELVVDASVVPGLSTGSPVEIRTPPGMSASPVFSRLSVLRHSTMIFSDSIFPSDPTTNSETQLRSLFSQLKRGLDQTGSDWMHLVKATYYVSDKSLDVAHNLVRPDYYSPRRPPAASKAMVRGVGRPGLGFNSDFIFCPAPP